MLSNNKQMSGIHRALVVKVEANTTRIYIPGLTNISLDEINKDKLPIAKYCVSQPGNIQIMEGEPVWIMFEGGDSRHPVILYNDVNVNYYDNNDYDDYDYDDNFNYGEDYVEIPQQYGTVYSWMAYFGNEWNNKDSIKERERGLKTGAPIWITHYKAKDAGKYSVSKEGYAMIDKRICIATTGNIGNKLQINIGDYLDVFTDTGIKKCIAGERKNINDVGANSWGHQNGKCVVEIVYDQLLIGYKNKVPNWGKTQKISRVGKFIG